MTSLPLTYVLPLRWARPGQLPDLTAYLHALTERVEVIVVDGSAPAVFAEHARIWPRAVHHLPVDADLVTPMGKVGGVLTGLRHARHDRVLVADDDVRWDAGGLERMAALLADADLVVPQNVFSPLPWHARWDTARTLLNRAGGQDWPGTLGVRRGVLLAAGGYAGDVLFENLELQRTVEAAGGRVRVALDLYVRRLPPTAAHFQGQRVRQAYDELARPRVLLAEMAALPTAAWLVGGRRWRTLAAGVLGLVAIAEAGRRRSGGAAVFPASSSLLAPAWVLERGVCIWVAAAQWALGRGTHYGGGRLRRAATPPPELRDRVTCALSESDRPLPTDG